MAKTRRKRKRSRKTGRKKLYVRKNWPVLEKYTPEQISEYSEKWKMPMRQAAFHLYHDDFELKLGICEICKKKRTAFRDFWRGYKRICSYKCNGKNPKRMDAVKNYIIRYAKEKYDFDMDEKSPSYFKIPQVQEKIKKLRRLKYGYSYIFQNPEIRKKALEKSFETTFKKYGVRTYFMTEKFKKKREKFLQKVKEGKVKIAPKERKKGLKTRLEKRNVKSFNSKYEIIKDEWNRYLYNKSTENKIKEDPRTKMLRDKKSFEYLIYEELLEPKEIAEKLGVKYGTVVDYMTKHGYTVSKIRAIIAKEREKIEEKFE